MPINWPYRSQTHQRNMQRQREHDRDGDPPLAKRALRK
jgi:hypothetical protein